MNFAIKLAVAALCIIAFGCETDKPVNSKESTHISNAKDSSVADISKPVSAPCSKRIKDFLRWYLKFEDNGKDSALIFNFPVTPSTDSAFVADLPRENVSSTRYIQMNWPKVENYLAVLQESGYFSSSYLQEKRKSIRKRGQALEARQMDDGEPEGFEADEIFWIMELYEPSDIEHILPYKNSQMKAGTSAFEVPVLTTDQEGSDKFSFLVYLKNENGRCLIDSIAHLRAGKQISIMN